MAEGVLRAVAGDCFEVESAGTEKTQVHPLAILAMNELGIDIAGHHSKQIAAKLNIGEKTVAKHRARVFEKMRIDSVAALVHLAYTCGLISRAAGLDASSNVF